MKDELQAAEALVRPARLWTREEVLTRPSPVPAVAGDLRLLLLAVADRGGHQRLRPGRWVAAVVCGDLPKPPPTNGTRASRQQLGSRLRQHYRGNVAGSTLRLTLGCLLASELGLQLRRVGGGQRLTFADGEQRLSEWMGRHARVCWLPHPRPWELEQALVGRLDLPLNLHGNHHHRFYANLRSVRAAARTAARALPVWTAASNAAHRSS